MSTQIVLGILAPVLGFLGIIAGALFTRSRENERLRRDRITECYARFIEAQSASSRLDFTNAFEKRLRELPLSVDEARLVNAVAEMHNTAYGHLFLYASPQVLGAIDEFHSHVDGLRTEDGRQAYARLIKLMREDTNAENDPDIARHLDNILITGPETRRQLLGSKLRGETA